MKTWLFNFKGEPRLPELIIPELLNEFLSEFFITIKKVDGSDYEPSTIDSIKFSIDRYLKDKYYPASIITDKIFHKTRQAINARKVDLKTKGLGRKRLASEPLDDRDQEILVEGGFIGTSNPKSLQFSLFYYFSKGFGTRGRQEHRSLKYGDIQIKKDSDGNEYIEMVERLTKTMDGTKRNDHRDVTPKIFSAEVVGILKEFQMRRPNSMKNDDSPFYLTPIPQARLADGQTVWYYAVPMGANTLGSLLKKTCDSAGISGKKTNHSLRKSTVRELISAGVPAHKVIKITGHKQASSLQHYDKGMSIVEHQKISSILCDKNKTKSTPIPPRPNSKQTVLTPEPAYNTEYQSKSHAPIDRNRDESARPTEIDETGSPAMCSTSTSNQNNEVSQINVNVDVLTAQESAAKTGQLDVMQQLFQSNSTFNNCTFNFNFK